MGACASIAFTRFLPRGVPLTAKHKKTGRFDFSHKGGARSFVSSARFYVLLFLVFDRSGKVCQYQTRCFQMRDRVFAALVLFFVVVCFLKDRVGVPIPNKVFSNVRAFCLQRSYSLFFVFCFLQRSGRCANTEQEVFSDTCVLVESLSENVNAIYQIHANLAANPYGCRDITRVQ